MMFTVNYDLFYVVLSRLFYVLLIVYMKFHRHWDIKKQSEKFQKIYPLITNIFRNNLECMGKKDLPLGTIWGFKNHVVTLFFNHFPLNILVICIQSMRISHVSSCTVFLSTR